MAFQSICLESAPLTTYFSFLMTKLICVQHISDEGHVAALVVCTVLREIVLANLKDADEAATSPTGREEVGRLHGGGRKEKKVLGLKTARTNKQTFTNKQHTMTQHSKNTLQLWSRGHMHKIPNHIMSTQWAGVPPPQTQYIHITNKMNRNLHFECIQTVRSKCSCMCWITTATGT